MLTMHRFISPRRQLLEVIRDQLEPFPQAMSTVDILAFVNLLNMSTVDIWHLFYEPFLEGTHMHR